MREHFTSWGMWKQMEISRSELKKRFARLLALSLSQKSLFEVESQGFIPYIGISYVHDWNYS